MGIPFAIWRLTTARSGVTVEDSAAPSSSVKVTARHEPFNQGKSLHDMMLCFSNPRICIQDARNVFRKRSDMCACLTSPGPLEPF